MIRPFGAHGRRFDRLAAGFLWVSRNSSMATTKPGHNVADDAASLRISQAGSLRRSLPTAFRRNVLNGFSSRTPSKECNSAAAQAIGLSLGAARRAMASMIRLAGPRRDREAAADRPGEGWSGLVNQMPSCSVQRRRRWHVAGADPVHFVGDQQDAGRTGHAGAMKDLERR